MCAEHLEHQACEARYPALFAPALLDPHRGTPTTISGPNGKAADKRYNVYRNNVTVSLIDALAATFPATLRITGADFFRAMARFYVRATAPTSPLLFEYGRDFPDFIEAYEYARPVPHLPDVARIERAWLDAYHAGDAEPLRPEVLAAIPSEGLANTVLTAHPATRIIRSRYPAVSIFAAYRSESPFGQIAAANPEDALVTRPELDVVVRHLPAGGAAFLMHLIAGEPLSSAVTAALTESPDFDLPGNIAGMLAAGAFTTVLETDHERD